MDIVGSDIMVLGVHSLVDGAWSKVVLSSMKVVRTSLPRQFFPQNSKSSVTLLLFATAP